MNEIYPSFIPKKLQLNSAVKDFNASECHQKANRKKKYEQHPSQ